MQLAQVQWCRTWGTLELKWAVGTGWRCPGKLQFIWSCSLVGVDPPQGGTHLVFLQDEGLGPLLHLWEMRRLSAARYVKAKIFYLGLATLMHRRMHQASHLTDIGTVSKWHIHAKLCLKGSTSSPCKRLFSRTVSKKHNRLNFKPVEQVIFLDKNL